MRPGDLSVDTELVSGAAVVTVAGEVDLSSAAFLQDELRAALEQSPTVVVDVSGMTFIDSSGLNALVHAHRSAQEAGSELRVRQPTPMFRKLLQITRLETLFVVDDGGDATSLPTEPAS